MIDIVIPLGVESRWQDNEVRYALRGIEKYLTGYRNVYIIGKKRKWIREAEDGQPCDRGVVYIDVEENYSMKQKSIFGKMLAASKDERISDPFCMWHDDHFLLKPLNIKDIKYWKWGTLDNLQVMAQGTYKNAVINTNKYLKAMGQTNFHFDIHIPILFEKAKFATLEEDDWSRDHVIKSLYGNKFGIRGDEMRDLKFGRPFRREEIRKAIEGRVFFSISEHGTNEAMKDVLGELYPVPSKYECTNMPI